MFSNRCFLSSHLSKQFHMPIPGCKELWEGNYLGKVNMIAMIGSNHFCVCTGKFEIPLVFKEGESRGNKRNKLLTHAITWMNLKSIMLSERSQNQRLHTVWFNLWHSKKSKTVFDRNQISGFQKWEREFITKKHRGFSDNGNLFYLDCHDKLLFKFVNFHKTICLNTVTFTLCKLYSNKQKLEVSPTKVINRVYYSSCYYYCSLRPLAYFEISCGDL